MGVSYLLALLPGRKLAREMDSLSGEMSARYGIRASPIYAGIPKHLSLFWEDEIGEDDAKGLTRMLRDDCRHIPPFRVEINGLGYFGATGGRTRYTVYLKVKRSAGLSRLQRAVGARIRAHATARFGRFVPHITIARSGLDRRRFLAIRRDYKKFAFERSFAATSLFAGTQHGDGGNWRFAGLAFARDRALPRGPPRSTRN